MKVKNPQPGLLLLSFAWLQSICVTEKRYYTSQVLQHVLMESSFHVGKSSYRCISGFVLLLLIPYLNIQREVMP